MVESSQNLNPAEVRVKLNGIAVSRGIGIGNAVFLDELSTEPGTRYLDAREIPNEVERLHFAARAARASYARLSRTTESASGIVETHGLMLESFANKAEALIRARFLTAESAIAAVSDSYATVSATAIDRRVDIIDVAERLTSALGGSGRSTSQSAGSVLIAREMRPSSVMEYANAKPAAIVTERGGWTSHCAIIARELGIPMVTGIRLADLNVKAGDRVIVDGNRGEISLGGSTETTFVSIETNDNNDLGSHMPTDRLLTSDEIEVKIFVNLDTPDQYHAATRAGVQGIGLYRSELLIRSNGPLPSESEQHAAYLRIANAVAGKPVSIRTFDIGCDELDRVGSSESNPALGLRSIRLGLSNENIIRTQIRAIIRANTSGNIRIVLPFVSGVGEIRRARRIVADEMEKLGAENKEMNLPPVGIMIEVPSAVLLANELAEHADFMCLGTNDLVQYLLAVDRDNEMVSEWYQTLHPAVIRAIKHVASAALTAGKPLTACGEMAGSPFYVPLLIGLGVRELSMMISSVNPVRRLISGISSEECRALSDRVSDCLTSTEVEYLLRDHYRQEWSNLFPRGLLESPVL